MFNAQKEEQKYFAYKAYVAAFYKKCNTVLYAISGKKYEVFRFMSKFLLFTLYSVVKHQCSVIIKGHRGKSD